jgi:hypothetical protein
MEGLTNDGGPRMTEPNAARRAGGESAARRLKPAPLLFEPAAAVHDAEHFFDLESIEEPDHLLARSTELALAFRAAADRATEYQAMAAAQLADPRRFDRMTCADIAARAGWSEDYAKRMVEFGGSLLRQGGPLGAGEPPPSP